MRTAKTEKRFVKTSRPVTTAVLATSKTRITTVSCTEEADFERYTCRRMYRFYSVRRKVAVSFVDLVEDPL